MSRNIFRDPSGGRPDYRWHINHSSEREFGRRRNIEHTAPTGVGNPPIGGVGLVKQQGADDPLTISLEGTILQAAQHREFVLWLLLSQSQSIHFIDFAGDAYEVIITAYQPVRKRTARNPRDRSAPLHYWTYQMDMEVLRVLSGPWLGIAP